MRSGRALLVSYSHQLILVTMERPAQATEKDQNPRLAGRSISDPPTGPQMAACHDRLRELCAWLRCGRYWADSGRAFTQKRLSGHFEMGNDPGKLARHYTPPPTCYRVGTDRLVYRNPDPLQ